jgi:hypothetical protein
LPHSPWPWVANEVTGDRLAIFWADAFERGFSPFNDK